jgi:hypothetical protein
MPGIRQHRQPDRERPRLDVAQAVLDLRQRNAIVPVAEQDEERRARSADVGEGRVERHPGREFLPEVHCRTRWPSGR